MSANLHVDVHLHGPLRPLVGDILVTDAGPFATLTVPAGSSDLVLMAADPADLRALAAACDRAASDLEARLSDRYAASEPAPGPVETPADF